MIPVARIAKPKEFNKRVATPGKKWLAEHPGAKRPKSFWDQYLTVLANGFHDLCGYAAMFDPTGGTVDHYLSFKNHPELAYEWSNYRFASNTLNSSKRNADDTVLDPFEVGDGWFEIMLPSLQLRVTDIVPSTYREKAEFTIKRLKLRDGERVIRWRKAWYESYLNGGLTLNQLRTWAPLIADAVAKNAAPAPVTKPRKKR